MKHHLLAKRHLFLLAAGLSLAASAGAAPKRIRTFDQLMSALSAGHTVRAVFDYAKTTLRIDGKEEKAPEAVGGMKFDNWEYFAAGVVRNQQPYLVTSQTQLIAHPRYGHVLNYVRARIYADGSTEITAQYLKPQTYEVVMDETFSGKLSSGKDHLGIHLFTER